MNNHSPLPAASFGTNAPDADPFGPLLGPAGRGALHEISALPSQAGAGLGFALALAHMRAAGRPILHVAQNIACGEAGALHGAGASAFGLDPAAFLLALARDDAQALQAALEGARSSAPGAAVVELFGPARALDLTASRRLALAAERSGVFLALLRLRGEEGREGSAACARWRVGPAPSRPLEANAPGPPRFDVRLERHRGGWPEQRFLVEWDHARGAFRPAGPAALSRPVGAFPAGRTPAAQLAPARRRRA